MMHQAMRKGLVAAGAMALALLASGSANATGFGQPVPWGIDLQDAASDVKEYIHWFHNYLMVIITVVTLFVMGLMIAVVVKFRESKNPVPSKVTHHVGLEVAWTVLPVLILIAIAVPSFDLLFKQLTIPKADVTIKVTGKQWFWSYEYPDLGKVGFDQYIMSDADIQKAVAEGKGKKEDFPRLLAVDNEVVVPVGKTVVLLVTAADVIHSFALQAFGVKIDAVPGRLNQTWFRANKEGIFYGQCSELCGKDHAFMPIAFRVVSEDKYKAWSEDAKKRFALGTSATTVASVPAEGAAR